MRHAFGCLALLLAGGVAAQATITLSGSLGAGKALLVIDGHPVTLAVGATAQGVTLRRLGADEADIVVDGRVQTLHLGAPARLAAESAGSAMGSEIVLPAGSGGHFFANGQINGKAVRFIVDTGATTVALSESEAARIGLEWRNGQHVGTATAAGIVISHAVTLRSVRIGDVEVFNVAAIVIPAEMPAILLGNTFLSRFSMRRDNDVMHLERKR